MKARMLGFVVVAVVSLMLAGVTSPAHAGTRIGIGINLPVFTFAAPPPVVVIPGTYAYFAPEADIDIVFYNGFWYRPYEGRWFRARGYNGPWGHIEGRRVPGVLRELPPDYRRTYRERPRIAYRDFHRNWRGWEKSRHWERDEGWRSGREHYRPQKDGGHRAGGHSRGGDRY
jgi:hypothetical protein